jgi:hypothetical protein
MDANAAAVMVTETILGYSKKFIPQRLISERKSTHPWLNDRVIKLVAAKRASEGTDFERQRRDECSAGILEEFGKYAAKERNHLSSLPRGAKLWWSIARRLMQRKSATSSIPALRNGFGEWILDSNCKANLFVDTFSKKVKLAAAEENEYSAIGVAHYAQPHIPTIADKFVNNTLRSLKEDSATGPDALPARILKYCAAELAKPVTLLANRIIETGEWPETWLMHWVVPLFKKKNVFDPENYRGIHMTPQLSKVVERLVKSLLTPFLSSTIAFGPNQFAYTASRGARDVLALLMLLWLQALAEGKKIAVYCSDVSGAFDRVRFGRLVSKLKAKKIHPDLIALLTSWLRPRKSKVIVGGVQSKEMPISNMVYQGTVLGPTLWNLFFEDARDAINEYNFTEVVFADDLNAFRVFSSTAKTKDIQKSMQLCQSELHKWGKANQVAFDASKESQHILSLTDPEGDNFRMLGVTFDRTLTMADAVEELVASASWKLGTLIRTRRYYTDADLIILYKSQLLSFIEYRTLAIYHACRAVLVKLDMVLTKLQR